MCIQLCSVCVSVCLYCVYVMCVLHCVVCTRGRMYIHAYLLVHNCDIVHLEY